MQTAADDDRIAIAEESNGKESAGNTTPPHSEEIVIRSYDHQQAYDLNLTVESEPGRTIFHEQYYLLPGEVETESRTIPSGEYTIHVTLDNAHKRVVECSLSERPENTLVIEVGNGILSCTKGLYQR